MIQILYQTNKDSFGLKQCPITDGTFWSSILRGHRISLKSFPPILKMIFAFLISVYQSSRDTAGLQASLKLAEDISVTLLCTFQGSRDLIHSTPAPALLNAAAWDYKGLCKDLSSQ